MEEKEFPKTIIMPEEADTNRHSLRVMVQKVQAAFLALKEDTEFTLPPKFEELTPEYVRQFYKPKLERIESDILLDGDDEKRHKLEIRWRRKWANTSAKVNVIRSGIESTPILKWRYDEALQMPTPTANIDGVSDKLASRNVPPLAHDHWMLVHAIATGVRGLRAWERAHGIVKQPLSLLTSWDEQEMARRWVRGMTIDPNEDERTKSIRIARENHIF